MLKVTNLCQALSFSSKVCIIFPSVITCFSSLSEVKLKFTLWLHSFPRCSPPYFCTRTLWVQLFMCKFIILQLGFSKIHLELWLQLTHWLIVNRTHCIYTCCHSFAAYFVSIFGKPFFVGLVSSVLWNYWIFLLSCITWLWSNQDSIPAWLHVSFGVEMCIYLSIHRSVNSSIHLSGFITAVAIFRKPNAIPLCFFIDPVPNFLSRLPVLLLSSFLLDILFPFSPLDSIP